jgi:Skp family chaperone for outer membrane proteins
MNKIFNFKTLVSFSALIIAGCAALFSVTGIGTLFAGAAISVMVMASALELGKLVGISFLYRYWTEIPRILKSYMLVASIVLIGITSAGIYGYLSSAYAKVAAEPLKMNAEIQIYNAQIGTIEEEIKRKTIRLDQIISLRSQQENRIDNLITKSVTGSNSTIRSAQNSLTELNRTATQLQKEINQTSAQRDSLTAKSLTTEVSISTNSDIGTFIYISRAMEVPLDTVVKWFILVIVLVFDPLSICLVLAYNFLQKREIIVEQPIQLTMFNEAPPDPTPTPQLAEIVVPESIVTEETMIKRTEEPVEEERKIIPFNNGDWDEEDPFPQYMTKAETEEVLERWWARRNGVNK